MRIIDRRSWFLSVAVWLLACASDDPKRPPARHDEASVADAPLPDAGPSDAAAADAALPLPEGCPLTPLSSCPSPAPHYADIDAIIKNRCFTCHDGTGEQWGLTSYEHVADWFNEIRAQMIACTMPPLDSGITMPTSERMEIVQWIRCGLIADFTLIEVGSREEAIAWVKRWPSIDGGGHVELELRQIFEMDDFGELMSAELRLKDLRQREELSKKKG